MNIASEYAPRFKNPLNKKGQYLGDQFGGKSDFCPKSFHLGALEKQYDDRDESGRFYKEMKNKNCKVNNRVFKNPSAEDSNTNSKRNTDDTDTALLGTGTESRIGQLFRAGKKILFIKSLQKSTTVAIVEQSLSQYGEIIFVQLPFNKKKKKNIGYCFIVFEDNSVAQNLLENVKEVTIMSRVLPIQPFILRPPAQSNLRTNPRAHNEMSVSGECCGLDISDHSNQNTRDTQIGIKKVQAPGIEEKITPSSDLWTPSNSKMALTLTENGPDSHHHIKPTVSLYQNQRKDGDLNHSPVNLVIRIRKLL